MDWRVLNDLEQLNFIIGQSFEKPIAIFKHSTTCPISSIAKKRIEQEWPQSLEIYYLDLLAYRSISNAIAETLNVVHESPQLIVLHKGVVVYHASHLNIELSALNFLYQSNI